MEEITFAKKVYSLCRKIPAGKVTTYQELGKALHCKAYRAIGQALKRNPYAPEVPCHRVIRSDGSLGGFRGKDTKQKKKLLRTEKIQMIKNKIDLKEYLFEF